MKFTVTAAHNGTKIQQRHEWHNVTAPSKQHAIDSVRSASEEFPPGTNWVAHKEGHDKMKAPANLSCGMTLEINFVVAKFQRLGCAMQRLIYEGLQYPQESPLFGAAACSLLQLLTLADNKELTGFANEQFGTSLSGYIIFPEDAPRKGVLIAQYFMACLRLNDDVVSISPLPVKRKRKS